MPRMTADELNEFLRVHFPDSQEQLPTVEHVDEMTAELRLTYHAMHLRPGGTISGAALMTLADTAMYAALLAMIGPVAMAVTTNLNINFLRKPAPVDVIAKTQLIKLGKVLAVGEVSMYSDGQTEMVAHATVTYSIPKS